MEQPLTQLTQWRDNKFKRVWAQSDTCNTDLRSSREVVFFQIDKFGFCCTWDFCFPLIWLFLALWNFTHLVFWTVISLRKTLAPWEPTVRDLLPQCKSLIVSCCRSWFYEFPVFPSRIIYLLIMKFRHSSFLQLLRNNCFHCRFQHQTWGQTLFLPLFLWSWSSSKQGAETESSFIKKNKNPSIVFSIGYNSK